MKKLFSVNNTTATIDAAIFIIRVAVGGLMLTHGLPKMAMLFSDGAVMFPPIFGLTPTLSLILAAFSEVLCSVLILTGFGTRLAVIPLSITMLTAIFLVHANDPFSNKELAVHYLFTYIVLFITGSGRYSLDYLLQPTPAAKSFTTRKAEDPTLSIYQ